MTNDLHIPMSRDKQPQQSIYEVITLLPKPEQFDCIVGFRQFPEGSMPSTTPRKMTYLAQVEWVWSQVNNRLDAYYLHKGRTHWSLWSHYWVDNCGHWSDMAIGCVPRRGVSVQQASVYLLVEFWKDAAADISLDEFHWINKAEYLSVAELMAIVREVW